MEKTIIEKCVNGNTHELLRLNGIIRQLIECTSNISIIVDRETNIIYCSDSILSLLNQADHEGIIGNSLRKVVVSFGDVEYAERCGKRISRVLAGEDSLTEDDLVYWPSGECRMYQIIYRKVLDTSGDFDGIIIIMRDLTDVRLEESKRRINDMLHSTLLPCVLWDRNGHVIVYNQEVTNVFRTPENLTPEEMDNFLVSQQPEFQPDGRRTEDIRQSIIQVALQNGLERVTVNLMDRNGTPIYFEVNAARVSWLSDYRVIAYFYDMTEKIMKEAEAKEAEDRLKLMIDCNPMMCILRDDQGNIIDCNQEALNILGVSSKTEFFANFYSYYPEFQPDGTRSVDKTREILKTLNNDGEMSLERLFQSATGELIPVASKLVRIPWKHTFYYLSFSMDLRETKANEKKMAEIAEKEHEARIQREIAQAANEAKSRFMANMSHEIRTPMNAVLGMSELLLQEKLTSRQIRHVKDIKTSAIALLGIINDVLDASKMQAGKLCLVPVNYDLHAMIDNIVSISEFLIENENKNLDFKLVMQDVVTRCLYGDDVRVRQVLLNLLSNAIKFTTKGHIHLIVNETDTSIQFTVSDTGMGIRTEDIPRLFEVFEQVDLQKNRNITGTGLGLPISKGLVEMMGGQISLKSVYGKGTTFLVEIPKVIGDETLIYNADGEDMAINAPDAKILVVDDNKINLNVACGLLELCNIKADVAMSGQDAIDMVQREHYDIVFMDHKMPEMSGVEATQIIREMGIDVTIIALTASTATNAKEMMLEAGMNDYLPKPIIKRELSHLLKVWLPREILLSPPSRTAAVNSNGDEMYKDFWRRIDQIDGLSVSTGLDRVAGQPDSYIKLLKLLINEIEKCCNKLTAFLSANDMRNFCIEVHSMKGSLANIGAMRLAAEARMLETASERGDTAFCSQNLPAFLEGIMGLSCRFQEAFAEVGQRNNLNGTPPELPLILNNLINAFDRLDLVNIEKEMRKLDSIHLSSTFEDMIDPIKDAVMIMDYDDATIRIRKLLQNE